MLACDTEFDVWNGATNYYHGPGIAVAFVDHFDRGSPDILSLALLHLPPLFSPAEQLLDASGCRAPETQEEDCVVRNERRTLWVTDCPAALKASLSKGKKKKFNTSCSLLFVLLLLPLRETAAARTPSALAMHISLSTG